MEKDAVPWRRMRRVVLEPSSSERAVFKFHFGETFPSGDNETLVNGKIHLGVFPHNVFFGGERIALDVAGETHFALNVADANDADVTDVGRSGRSAGKSSDKEECEEADRIRCETKSAEKHGHPLPGTLLFLRRIRHTGRCTGQRPTWSSYILCDGKAHVKGRGWLGMRFDTDETKRKLSWPVGLTAVGWKASFKLRWVVKNPRVVRINLLCSCCCPN